MTFRPTTSWQTILADLALILFMVTASALGDPAIKVSAAPSQGRPAKAPPVQPVPIMASLRAEPVGVWSEGPGAPALSEWVAQQGGDPRLRATVVVHHLGHPDAALDHARRLVDAIGARRTSTRVVVEPGASEGATVTLGYDSQGLAR